MSLQMKSDISKNDMDTIDIYESALSNYPWYQDVQKQVNTQPIC